MWDETLELFEPPPSLRMPCTDICASMVGLCALQALSISKRAMSKLSLACLMTGLLTSACETKLSAASFGCSEDC